MKNQREIYEALLAGETLISVNFIKVKLKDDNLDITSIKETHISNAIFKNPNEWQIYKEPKWYENFPDGGVLCWHHRELCIVSNPSWSGLKEAKPLTKQEIQIFMDNAPEKTP